MDLLAADDRFSFGDMNRINMDAGYNHIAGMNFLHYVIEASEEAAPTDPDVAVALPYLKAWNYHYNDLIDPRWPNPAATYDDPGLTIFDAWYSGIFNRVFADDLPSGVSAWPSTLIHVFDGADSKLPLSYDYLNGTDRNTVIVQVLKQALAYLTTKYGTSDMSMWLTPVRKVKFSQMGALPAPTMHYMNRGTYNHIAEMPSLFRQRRPPHAVDVIPPGQSGFVKLEMIDGVPTPVPSPHAYDQLPLYETWQYKPMLFRINQILEVAESTTTLTYP
jgi:acyl-homoserine lactone acylase PvdQ